jgi:cell division protein FtsB
LKQFIKYISIALLAIFLASCDRGVVSVGEYEAMRSRAESLQAENDSLQFELSSLKMYVNHLEEDNAGLVEELKRIPINEE